MKHLFKNFFIKYITYCGVTSQSLTYINFWDFVLHERKTFLLSKQTGKY